MPQRRPRKFYCQYCDKMLRNNTAAVRRLHYMGKQHQNNMRQYYEQYERRHPEEMANFASIVERSAAAYYDRTGQQLVVGGDNDAPSTASAKHGTPTSADSAGTDSAVVRTRQQQGCDELKHGVVSSGNPGKRPRDDEGIE